ncbi:hypothetical protein TrST_g10815 [Triparma strigata]|uniref:Uncharacterized protein n=1 Tax=Triparma strigata TaxID=1606541 RepID=A0A9W7BZB2_9STRA|nr:hypothetical protein TrST_g10815 [Triparma strigata]
MSYHGSKKNKNAYKIPVDSVPLPTRAAGAHGGGGGGGGGRGGGKAGEVEYSSSGGNGEEGGSKPISWDLGGAGVGGPRAAGSPRQSASSGSPRGRGSPRSGGAGSSRSPRGGEQHLPGRGPGGEGYEHIPENLRQSFHKQMTELLSANDRLNEQNEMLKKNRGVKIDHDQFKSWKNQIDDLRFSLEEAEEKEKLLTEENSMQATMIVDLEEELRKLRMRGKQQEEEIKELKEATKPKWGEGTRSQDVQTNHTGSIPVIPKKPTMSSLGGTQTDVKLFTSTPAQTDAEAKPKPATPRKKAPEKISDAELDNMMIMEELNEIRKILELAQGDKDNSSSKAWSEVCSHGVMGGVSAVKQRAKTFRQELDYLRKQVRQFKTENAVRRMSSGGMRGSPLKRSSFTSPIKSEETMDVGSPAVKLLEIGGPPTGGAQQRLSEANSTIFNGLGGGRRKSGDKLPMMSGSPMTALQQKQAKLKAHIINSGGGGSPGGDVQPRRPSGARGGGGPGGPHFVGQPGGYN